MKREIEEFLEPLDGELTPIREIATRFVDDSARIDEESGALLIGPRPELDPHHYSIVLFPGLTDQEIDARCDLWAKARGGFPKIPQGYRTILNRLNGLRSCKRKSAAFRGRFRRSQT